MGDRITVPRLRQMKAKGDKIVCLTAYDAGFGALADAAGIDVVLVGDSLGNVLLGYATTIPVTMEQMLHHTAATRAGVSRALLVADLPFGSYQVSVQQGVESAIALMKVGADAVKLEGDYPDTVRAITAGGIPVMGHLGFTPQSVHAFGGHRVQGKGDQAAVILDQARRLQAAGAFGLVLELMPSELAKQITSELEIVTIGIGGGVDCDGQVQVLHDVLGLGSTRFKHAKRYDEIGERVKDALGAYAKEVRGGEFPGPENSF